MEKTFKTLECQVNYLKDNKSVVICDEQLAKKTLLKTNYYNFTACCKVKFAKERENGKFLYESSSFNDWHMYYDLDCKLSEHLMINFNRLEREINAKTAWYLSQLINSGVLSHNEKNELRQKIQSAKNCASYNLNETWRYIPKMTFGELVYLLIWLFENKKEVFSKIIADHEVLKKESIKRLHELKHLRNTLFHGRPLNIYLVYGNVNKLSLYQKRRQLLIRWVFQLRRDKILSLYLNEMIQFAKQFLNIKKQPT